MRVVTDLDELDRIFAECDRAASRSDDELRRVFGTFRMEIPTASSLDPFSEEYAALQMQLYERIAGRTYRTNNEGSVFDVGSAVVRPFPYTASCQVAGNHFGAISFLLRSMHLAPGSRVLDVGPGWGNTTLAFAQLGFEVTALDIEPRFCELITERARRVGVNPEIINSDFFWIERAGKQFDAIVFFESFHHCADHLRLLRALRQALTSEGKVYFGGEPITLDFPIPWGIRTDGESLWAIRRNGWLELGFQAKYFSAALQRSGFQAQMQSSADLPWINVWNASFQAPQAIQFNASDARLATQTGVKEEGFIHLQNSAEGYALHGPYTPLQAGHYLGEVCFRRGFAVSGSALMDVCVDSGQRVIKQAWLEDLPPGKNSTFSLGFELDTYEGDVELRLYCKRGFSGWIERVEFRRVRTPGRLPKIWTGRQDRNET